MKLVVGLGNPGAEYAGTRHNVGADALRQFAQAQQVALRPQPKYKALIGEYAAGSEKIYLFLPTTYYNLSGEAVRAMCEYYHIAPSEVLVVHDELALPLGTVRTRVGGSDAGNNGVKSVTQHIGQDTARIRIGIGNELREQMDDADFVLSKFNAAERATLADLQHVIEGCIEDFIYDSFAHTTHQAD
jgi:PTH1 family peptidyl-tRNA hydrolase